MSWVITQKGFCICGWCLNQFMSKTSHAVMAINHCFSAFWSVSQNFIHHLSEFLSDKKYPYICMICPSKPTQFFECTCKQCILIKFIHVCIYMHLQKWKTDTKILFNTITRLIYNLYSDRVVISIPSKTSRVIINVNACVRNRLGTNSADCHLSLLWNRRLPWTMANNVKKLFQYILSKDFRSYLCRYVDMSLN